jgi:hypothetical protein
MQVLKFSVGQYKMFFRSQKDEGAGLSPYVDQMPELRAQVIQMLLAV